MWRELCHIHFDTNRLDQQSAQHDLC
jgi:hypothetical protein